MDDEIVTEYYSIIKKKIADKRFDSAIQSADKLTQYYPENEYGFYYKGICYFALDEIDNAITNYEQAVKVNPFLAKAHFNLGLCYYNQKKDDKALISIGVALVLFSKGKEEKYRSKCIETLKSIKQEIEKEKNA